MRNALLDVTPLRSSPVFRRFWIGRTFSVFGSQLTLVAVLFQVWQQTSSPAWTGAAGLAQALPILVFGLFAGSIVDRTERRRFYLGTQAGQAVCSIVLAIQAFLGLWRAPGPRGAPSSRGCCLPGNWARGWR
ncbi:MFS transporter [Amycolatopsis pithecellobii]|uniref:MFS transporter n=1 Tax=Amycolatopsis pithecellobii TaxID=664692 RepID=UPI0028A6FDDE|nr:MFS transporter [Amycolatopsis pithecellobii]